MVKLSDIKHFIANICKKKQTYAGIEKKFFSCGQGKNALDFGCGSGYVSIELANNGYSVIAYDTDDTCKKNFSDLRPDIKDKISFFSGELTCFTQYNKYFDLIICREVLEHVPDRVALLHLFKKILSPRGTLIISVPTARSEKIFLRLDPSWLEKSQHTSILESWDLKKLFDDAGFFIEKNDNEGFKWSLLWLMLAPFRTAHHMGKILHPGKYGQLALRVSNAAANLPLVENIGNFLLPKSHVYYLVHKKPIILCIHDCEEWILGKWANTIKELYGDNYHIYPLLVDNALANKELIIQLTKYVDLVVVLLPHAFNFFYKICPSKIACAVHHWVNYTDMYENAINLSKYIITGAQEWQENILRKNPKAKIYLVHSGYDASFLSPIRSSAHTSKLAVGFFAKYTSNEYDRKGTRHLLQLIALLAQKGVLDNYTFIITGDGWDEPVEKMRSLGAHVIYHNRIPAEDIPKIYRKLDAYLILSDVEGGPATIAESLVSGVVPLTTRVGAARDFIEDGKNGFFIVNTDYLDIMEKLEFLRNNYEQRREIALNGYNFAIQNLSYKETFINFETLFSDAIDNFSPQPGQLQNFLRIYKRIKYL